MITEFQLKARKDWITNLRSGDFKQAKKALKVVTDGLSSYCCLGVLCHINKYEFRLPDGTADLVGPGIQFLKGIGFAEVAIQLTGLSFTRTMLLADMNDDGNSFNEVADVIEKWTKEDLMPSESKPL